MFSFFFWSFLNVRSTPQLTPFNGEGVDDIDDGDDFLSLNWGIRWALGSLLVSKPFTNKNTFSVNKSEVRFYLSYRKFNISVLVGSQLNILVHGFLLPISFISYHLPLTVSSLDFHFSISYLAHNIYSAISLFSM